MVPRVIQTWGFVWCAWTDEFVICLVMKMEASFEEASIFFLMLVTPRYFPFLTHFEREALVCFSLAMVAASLPPSRFSRIVSQLVITAL